MSFNRKNVRSCRITGDDFVEFARRTNLIQSCVTLASLIAIWLLRHIHLFILLSYILYKNQFNFIYLLTLVIVSQDCS